MTQVVFKFFIEAFYFGEMAGKEQAYEYVEVVAYAHTEDVAAEVEVIEGIGHVKKFVTTAGQFRLAVDGEQYGLYALLFENPGGADKALVEAGTADDDGQMMLIGNQGGGKLAV